MFQDDDADHVGSSACGNAWLSKCFAPKVDSISIPMSPWPRFDASKTVIKLPASTNAVLKTAIMFRECLLVLHEDLLPQRLGIVATLWQGTNGAKKPDQMLLGTLKLCSLRLSSKKLCTLCQRAFL